MQSYFHSNGPPENPRATRRQMCCNYEKIPRGRSGIRHRFTPRGSQSSRHGRIPAVRNSSARCRRLARILVALGAHRSAAPRLDRHLVSGIDTGPGRQALIGALAEFGRASGTVLVAEGVENDAELRTLLALGIPFGQGYRLGRPAPADAQRRAPGPGTPSSGGPAGARSRQHQSMFT